VRIRKSLIRPDDPVVDMATCDHCDSHVSDRFARVFADDGGHLAACPDCASRAGIAATTRQRVRSD
jgi:uncharacterized protein YlaI